MSDDRKTQRFVSPSLDPHRLQLFLAVYEHGTFAQAAKRCNVTQQAVSKSIARLEDQLGMSLFERSGYGAVPTNYAHVLAKRAKIILAESRLAIAEISAMRGSTAGYVQVGLGWSFFPRIAPEAIAYFRSSRPKVGLRVAGGPSAILFPQLVQGELDFVVSAPPMELALDPALEGEALFTEWDVVVMRSQHRLAAETSVNLEQLSRCTWLVSLSPPDRWNAICEAFSTRGIAPPSEVIDLDSLSLAKSMLVHDDYVCLLPEELVATEKQKGLFVTFRLPELPLNRPALLVTRRATDLQPAAEVLKNSLLRICRRLYP